MAEFSIAALAAYIAADANSRGFDTMTNGDVVSSLNLIRIGNAVDVATISAAELQNAVDPADWAALDQSKRDLWRSILAGGEVRVGSAGIRAQALDVFSPGNTRSALAALQQRDGSDAEKEWGSGFRVTLEQVREARSS